MDISPAEVRDKLDAGQADLVLLDCREAEEVAVASIAGAVHVPMGDIRTALPRLDPEHEYVVFCHHGVRSRMVAEFLRTEEFQRVRSMSGGIDAWSREIDPGVPRYDR